MSKCCCHGCPHHRAGCHGQCEDYKAYRAQLDKTSQAARHRKGMDNALGEIHRRRVSRQSIYWKNRTRNP